MTLETLDTYIKNYITYLRNTKAIRGMGDIQQHIVYSKKSRSFYVKLFRCAVGKNYVKTLRFSDHMFFRHSDDQYVPKGIVMDGDKEIDKRTKKHIEALIRKSIKELIYNSSMIEVYRNRTDCH